MPKALNAIVYSEPTDHASHALTSLVQITDPYDAMLPQTADTAQWTLEAAAVVYFKGVYKRHFS